MAEPPSKPSEEQQHHQYSTGELLSSAKLVAAAAQSTFRNESDKVDKAKAADAAGDLLDAASQYGKLDDQKGIGQYVDKASDYLHQYKGSSAPSNHPSSTTTPSESDPPKPESQGDAPQSGGGGGFGQFAKLAGDFLKKN